MTITVTGVDHKAAYDLRMKQWIDKTLAQDVDGYWYAWAEGDGGAWTEDIWTEDMVTRLLAEMQRRNAITDQNYLKPMPQEGGE